MYRCRKFMFQKVKIVCWTLAIFCNCSVLFGIADRRISLSTSILYTALSRTSWAFGISWLVIACCTNNGGKPIIFKLLIDVIMSFLLLIIIFLIHTRYNVSHVTFL